jgi:spore photoproduct lyase
MKFNKIIVEKKLKNHPAVKAAIKTFPDVPVIFQSNPTEFYRKPPEEISASKKILVLASQPGKFLTPCPGAKNYICCHYQVIENATNCPFDCSYCYLQSYLNRPYLYFYLNEKKMFRELAKFLKKNSKKYWRLGTGEFADSLALDRYLRLSEKLILFFAKQKNSLLELKTKSAQIKHLLKLPHNGRTVLAWSLNPPEIIETEEKGCASLERRLKAAAAAAAASYPVAFHFDPIIYFSGWVKAYKRLVEKIYSFVQPGQLAWISLGTLRFVPAFKEIFKKRFPEKSLLLEEFITGPDGKIRYFKPLRIKMYQNLLKNIRHYDKKTLVYLCMESPQIWGKIFADREKIISKGSPYRKYFNFQLLAGNGHGNQTD